MSTANFRQNSFPLYCLDDSEMEWWESRDIYDDLTEYGIKPLNNELRFFEISAISGYYCGLQLWVEHTRYAENAGFYDDCDTDDVTNEDCRYYLGIQSLSQRPSPSAERGSQNLRRGLCHPLRHERKLGPTG